MAEISYRRRFPPVVIELLIPPKWTMLSRLPFSLHMGFPFRRTGLLNRGRDRRFESLSSSGESGAKRLTPFREGEIVVAANPASGTMLAGAILALAIPLAAVLATSVTLIDIVVWGVVALVLQLMTLGIVSLVMRNFRSMIEAGNVAAAITLAGAQIAVALLNAAVMVPN